MIEVHHLNKSRSHRVIWLLEELEVPYELVRYERLPSMMAPPELRAIHPLGKSPVIRDGDLVLAESGAILEYLIERYGHGRLVPERGSPEWLRYIYFMHYAEGSLMPQLFLKLVIARLSVLGLPARGFVNRNIRTHLEFLEGELADRPYFAGEKFTAADIQMSYPLVAAMTRGGGEHYPRLVEYVARLRERPGLARAIEKAGPFEAPG
jgi:glutathione S-transferase